MRDILIKILEAIQALAPSDDEEEPAAESNVADNNRSAEPEEPEVVPVTKTKRSVK